MITMKCRMCGGDVEVNPDKTVGTCQYCGIASTFPKAIDDRKANLYNRANHYWKLHEYDKARSAYEGILKEDDTEAEAHWGVVLCKYGIEYVQELGTFVKVPTCHRMQLKSVLQDADYIATIEYADNLARDIYKREAERVDSVLKNFLEMSSKEEPYEVFICYKETDENNQRTRDSVLAQEIYEELTKSGFKVFYGRKALEGKHRNTFEPYVFNALNSAKAMVVVGTKAEYFSDAWVRNEWLRYHELLKAGMNKTLIPAYRDMDPYDIPDELGTLQALNMTKLGFMQSLYEELTKAVQKPDSIVQEPSQPEVKETTGTLESLLKRGMLFLEDGEFSKADEYFERILDEDPEEDRAYWGKLLVKLQCKSNEELINHDQSLESYDEYKKALRFSDGEKMEEYLEIERERETNVFATLDSAEELYKIGCKYYIGDGVPKDEMRAFERFSKAAEKGHEEAEEALGVFYERGIAVEKNYEKAAEWYQRAAEKGSADASLNLGNLYFNHRVGYGNEQENAFYWFLKSAERGNEQAQCLVGVCYYYNKGVPKDYEKAVEWFSKAAEQGYADAQYYLGLCYQEGNGVSKDGEKAEELIGLAAEQGHSLACRVFFITPGEVTQITCPQCGRKQMNDRSFCWKCGEQFMLIERGDSDMKEDNIFLKCMEMSF
jgi:TPR repeat protein